VIYPELFSFHECSFSAQLKQPGFFLSGLKIDELLKSLKMRWFRKKAAGKAHKPGPDPEGWD
jgi:hypothetical protein